MKKIFFKIVSLILVIIFTGVSLIPPSMAWAQNSLKNTSFPSALNSPSLGESFYLSDPFEPMLVKGVRIFPEDPLQFDFVIEMYDIQLNVESIELISSRFLLASCPKVDSSRATGSLNL